MAPRFQTAGPVAPEVSSAYGAAQQWSQDYPQIAAQQRQLAAAYEEATARMQQAAQFGASQQQQEDQFRATLANREQEFGVSTAQQERQFGAQMGQRQYEFGAGQNFQRDRDVFQAQQEEARFGAGQQFQAQRDIFGAQQQQARDVFGAQQQQGRDVFQAQRSAAEMGQQQQFQGQRDQFAAGAAQQQQQERFQLQAQLQQAELSQAETMRMQRLQQAADHVNNDQSLAPEERANLLTQIYTGLNPYQNRQAQAQMLHQQNAERLAREQFEFQQQQFSQTFELQTNLEQRRMDALNPANFPSRILTQRNPLTRQNEQFWMDNSGNIHNFEWARQPTGQGAGAGGTRSGSGGSGGSGGGRAPAYTLEQTQTLRRDVEAGLSAEAGWGSLTTPERESRIRDRMQWWVGQQRMVNDTLNPPAPEQQQQRPFNPTSIESMSTRQRTAMNQFNDWGNQLAVARGLDPRYPARLTPGQGEHLRDLLGFVQSVLPQYGTEERMPDGVRDRFEAAVEQLNARIPAPPPGYSVRPQVATPVPPAPAPARPRFENVRAGSAITGF